MRILCVLVGLTVVCGLVMAQTDNGTMTPTAVERQYGPCCPLAGNKPVRIQPNSYWSGTSRFRGPQRTCMAPRSIALAFDGKTRRVDAVQVGNTYLVPARVLAITGTDVQWEGAGMVSLSLGDRTVHLRNGSYGVQMGEGTEADTAQWPLCPRMTKGYTYVPLRAAAEALGFDVAYREGAVTLTPAETTVQTAATATECPADELESSLGVTVVRGPLAGPRGSGVGILAVTDGSRAAELGLRPRDVILRLNNQRVECPNDLQEMMSEAMNGQQVTSMQIVRGSRLMMLPAQ